MKLKRGIFIFIVLTLFWFTLLLAFYENYVFLAPSDDSDGSSVVDSDDGVASKGSSAGAGIDTAQFIGKGCTTAFFIDWDCDGYGVGGKNFPDILPPFDGLPDYTPPNLDPDANDDDSLVNTPQTVAQRYGDFSDINNYKNYLMDLGYTHQINNIYFISLNGDDLTAQPNNINRPYRNRPLPAVANQNPILRPGDVIVYRGGIYDEYLDTRWRQTWVAGPGTQNEGMQGTTQQPIILMNHPGERVIFRAPGGGASITKFTNNVIIRGFEFEGEYAPGSFSRQVIGFDSGGQVTNLEFNQIEVRNGDRWNIFFDIAGHFENIKFNRIAAHDTRGTAEHCLYMNDGGDGKIGTEIMFSNFYRCHRHGLHLRGFLDGTLIHDNIITSNAMYGIEMKNGVQNSMVYNNLIFNNGRGAISIFGTNELSASERRTNDNNAFFNNIIMTGGERNGMGIQCTRLGVGGCADDNPSTYPAITLGHDEDQNWNFLDHQFYNNIIVTWNAPIFYFLGNARLRINGHMDMQSTLMKNNLLYRMNNQASNNLMAMSVCDWTDGSHEVSGIQPLCQSYTAPIGNYPAYFWGLNTMQNSLLRPLITGNLFSNPLFEDVDSLYSTNPLRFNLDPTAQSPSINAGTSLGAPATDIRGNPRTGLVDIGAYEYNSGTSSGGNQQQVSVSNVNPASYCTAPQLLVNLQGMREAKIDGRNIVFSDNGTITFYDLGPDHKKSADDLGLIVPALLNRNTVNTWVPPNANFPRPGFGLAYLDADPYIYENKLVFVRQYWEYNLTNSSIREGWYNVLMYYSLGADGVVGNTDDSGPYAIYGGADTLSDDYIYTPRIGGDVVSYYKEYNPGIEQYMGYYCTLSDSGCQQSRIYSLGSVQTSGSGYGIYALRQYREVGFGNSNSYDGFVKNNGNIYYKNNPSASWQNFLNFFGGNYLYIIEDSIRNVLLFSISNSTFQSLAVATAQTPGQYTLIPNSLDTGAYGNTAVIANHPGINNKYLIAWHDYIAGYGSYPARGLQGRYKVASYPVTETLTVNTPLSFPNYYYYEPVAVDENNVVFSGFNNQTNTAQFTISECYFY